MTHEPDSSRLRCGACGASLTEEAPQGMCPACLMRAALQEGHDTAPTAGVGRPPSPPSVAAVAAAFPHLEVRELIGCGGMGAVFRARQPNLDRLVALKVIPAGAGGGDAFADRFDREGRLLARLHHPNIVTIFDSGRAGPYFYLLMEHVDGVSLRQALQAGRFAPADALRIVPQICDALQYAHEHGVLHRDIKPENILLDARGRVKLVDFGIGKLAEEAEGAAERAAAVPGEAAALTHVGAALGTPRYMAPEQAVDPKSVDHRADIYSLGVVFFELLTGEAPPAGAVRPSERVDVDRRVDAIVQQALERERERRQKSAGEMKTQIAAVQDGPSGESNPPWRVRFGWWRRRWVRSAAVVVLLVGLLRTFVIQTFEAKSDAAAPELPSGSWVVVWKLPVRLGPGDFIVYTQDDRYWLGGIEAVRGDEVVVRRFGRGGHVVGRSSVEGKVILQTRAARAAAGGVNPAEVTAAREEYAAAVQRHEAGMVGELPLARARHRLEVAEAGDDRLKVAEANVRWARTREDVAKKHAHAGTMTELDAKKAGLERMAREAELSALRRDLGLAAESEPEGRVAMDEWIQGTWAYDAEYSRDQARVASSATTEEMRRAAEEVLVQIKATLGRGSEGMRWTFTASHIQTHHAPGGPRSDPYSVLGRPGADEIRLRTTDAGVEKTMVVRREGERMRLDEESPRSQPVPHLEMPSYFKRAAADPPNSSNQ